MTLRNRQEPVLNHTTSEEPPFERWPPAGAITPPPWVMPGWRVTIWRGLRCICPHCGEGKIFAGYLRVVPNCAVCHAPLGDMPADDAPPYIAMVAVLHVLAIFLIVIFHFHYLPGIAGAIIWLALLGLLCCGALRIAKGMVIGILLKLGLKREPLHG